MVWTSVFSWPPSQHLPVSPSFYCLCTLSALPFSPFLSLLTPSNFKFPIHLNYTKIFSFSLPSWVCLASINILPLDFCFFLFFWLLVYALPNPCSQLILKSFSCWVHFTPIVLFLYARLILFSVLSFKLLSSNFNISFKNGFLLFPYCSFIILSFHFVSFIVLNNLLSVIFLWLQIAIH